MGHHRPVVRPAAMCIGNRHRRGPDRFRNKGYNLSAQVNKQQRKFAEEENEANEIFEIGDHVAMVNARGGAGVLVKEGRTPDLVLVRFGDLGIRSVRRAQEIQFKAQRLAGTDMRHPLLMPFSAALGMCFF